MRSHVARTTPTDDRPISEMRNLGPACERDLNAAGIMTAGELQAMGVEQAFLAMLQARKREGRSAKSCNAVYLYALYGAIHDVDWLDVPEAEKRRFKELTAEIRESGKAG